MARTKTSDTKEGVARLTEIWGEICRKQKPLMALMVVMAAASVVLLIFALTTLRPQSTVVITGYGDVYGEIAGISGGYRRDSWLNMLAFPALAVIYGFVHNIIMLRVYDKYGKDAAMVVGVATMLLIAGTVVVMLRLLGEW